MDFFSGFREKLLLYQLNGESDLFKLLNLLRLTQPDGDLRSIGDDEAKYFKFYRTCFELETLALLFLMPVGFYGYRFYKAFNRTPPDPRGIQKALVRLLITGVPALNLGIFNGYRRFFHELDCEKLHQRKYAEELREMRKRKPKK